MVQFDLLMGFGFFSFLVVYSPSPGTQRDTIHHRRAPDRPHILLFGYIFLRAIIMISMAFITAQNTLTDFEHIFDFLTPFSRPGGQIPQSGITS